MKLSRIDKMITMGPINDLALQGSSFELHDGGTAQKARRCSFVRISFFNQGSLEELTYPRDQCASWFVSIRFSTVLVSHLT